MAELILTDEEKAAKNYLSLPDEALGKIVKALASNIQDHHGDKAATFSACAVMIACMVAERGLESNLLKLDGVSDDGTEHGDWEILVRRQNLPQNAPPQNVQRLKLVK